MGDGGIYILKCGEIKTFVQAYTNGAILDGYIIETN
jgi:hypothetical protein